MILFFLKLVSFVAIVGNLIINHFDSLNFIYCKKKTFEALKYKLVKQLQSPTSL